MPISPKQRLDDVVRILSAIGGGGTNLALPMEYALQKHIEVDAFIILSDSESWAGKTHPSQALAEYRRKINPNARIINIQMTSTHVTNNNPDDRLAMECAGFDTNIPEVIAGFVRGDF